MARIAGGGLVSVIVTEVSPFIYYLFLNDRFVPQEEIESLAIQIDVDHNGMGPLISATLTRYVRNVTGESAQQAQSLFPCTIEFLAAGRRICISCPNPDSLDGLWITLGLRPDGTGTEVTGAKALRVVLTDTFLDARLTWMDGKEEDLFSA